MRRYVVELEPEVRDWLETLRLTEYAKVEAMADILAERAETLGEPYSRHLGGKTRELRFHLDRSAVRVSYWLAPQTRVVLLTVFRKSRQVERAESCGQSPLSRRANWAMRTMRRRPRSSSANGNEAQRKGGRIMTARHSRWERTGTEQHNSAYEEARAALLLGQMVYDRRTELGLTQGELAERAGMTQPQLSRLESGGATPTVPLLARLAAALDAELDITFKPHRDAAA